MESPKAIISEMGDAIRNTLLRVGDTIAGCPVGENDMVKLMGIGQLYNLEGDLAELQKKRDL